MRLRIGLLVVVILLSALPSISTAADCTAPGTRAATAEDATVKNGRFKVGDCINPKDEAAGEDSEEARKYLRSLAGSGSGCGGGQALSLEQQFNGLNNTFATCAARFLKAYREASGASVRINRSSNSPQCEGRMCYMNKGCGGLMTTSPNASVNSNHTRGLAMDVTSSKGNADMHNFASHNPQFGICFPLAWDTVHMILKAAGGGEGASARCANIANTCSGTAFDPKDIKYQPSPDPGPIAQPAQPPTQSMANAFRNFINPPPPPPLPPPAQQPLPAQQNPLSYIQPAPTPVPTPISEILNSPPPPPPKVAIDLIKALEDPKPTTTEKSTTEPLVLTIEGDDKTVLRPKEEKPTSSSTSGTYVVPVGETFVSPDLKNSQAYKAENTPLLSQVLETMKQTLLHALAYLRPFGGRAQAESTTYY